MRRVSIQTIYSIVLAAGLFGQCETVPPSASRLVYVSASQNNTERRLLAECAFRYSITNTFERLDTDRQREAIRAGFGVWQRLNPHVGFLELPARPVLTVKFVDPADIPNQTTTTPPGLVKGTVSVTGGLRREASGLYTILLSNTHDWDTNALTKAVAYHAGLLLGMATSTETGSLMSTLLGGQPVRATKADSVAVNKLYTTACRDLAVSYLPFSLTVGGPVLKTVRFDRQGIVLIKASGQMFVGPIVGTSGPDGLESGALGFSLAGYSFVPTMNHAALMYKLNNEANWHFCGHECSFSTNGLAYVDLLFNINDNTQSDNQGGYDVAVDYK